MVTAFSGCGPIEDIAPRTGAANPEATTASPSAAKSIVLDMRDMIPSSCAASHSPRIKVFRNAQRRGKTECGGWDFPLRASRARLLNPWTPARPDLKSGAVVQAWLPPHAAHWAIGIMLLLRCSETSFPLLSLRTGMRSRIIWLELSILLLTLLFAEFGEVLREIRTDVVLDWFITLAPLIWIDASIVVLYAFFRLYFTPELVPPRTSAAMKRVSAFLVPNTRVLRGGTRLRKVWAISAVVGVRRHRKRHRLRSWDRLGPNDHLRHPAEALFGRGRRVAVASIGTRVRISLPGHQYDGSTGGESPPGSSSRIRGNVPGLRERAGVGAVPRLRHADCIHGRDGLSVRVFTAAWSLYALAHRDAGPLLDHDFLLYECASARRSSHSDPRLRVD